MPFLKKKTKEPKGRMDADKLVGIYIPKSEASYLSLYCAAEGVSLTSVLKPLVIEWIEESRDKMDINVGELILQIADRALTAWRNDIQKGNSRRTRFNIFYTELENELKRKKIPEIWINKILKEVKDGKD